MEKDLYFLRHGIAVLRGTPGIRDFDRPLTEEGQKKLIRSVKGMQSLNLVFDAILSSPLVRAFETAEVVVEHLPFGGEIEIEETLRPEGELRDFLSRLKTRPEQRILLTGHEPAMSLWVQALLGCETTGTIRLKKGALCHLKIDLSGNPPWTEMIFLIQPKILRSLG